MSDDNKRAETSAAEAEMRFLPPQDASQLDMKERDPNNLNAHILYSFHEVIGEPEGAHSADCVWTNSFKCFNCTAGCCYTFLTYLCGIPAAFCWGCNFACLAFGHIWCMTPSIKYLKIALSPAIKLYAFAVQCLCVPVFEASALVLSKIGFYKTDQPPPRYQDRQEEAVIMLSKI